MAKSTIFFLICLLAILPRVFPCGCNDDDDHFVPRKPDYFCTAFDFIDYPIQRTDLDGYVHTPSFDSKGNINYILMTSPDHAYCNSHLWLANTIDVRNGFRTQFKVDVGDHRCQKLISKTYKVCTLFNWGCTYYYDYSYNKCGAEGFAFVLQNSNRNATGLAGSGLGYEKIKDTLAVEFDFQHTAAKNDPVTRNEYHISVIMKKGLATAMEDDSIVNNYDPTNFVVPRYTGGSIQSVITIEYLNSNLRVFVNGILQLGYFKTLDFQQQLGTSAFFLGLTASNSEAGSKINLLDWDLSLVGPNIGYSTNALVLSKSKDNTFQINEAFKVNIYLKNGCKGKYYPNSIIDDPSQFSLDNRFALSCVLGDRVMTPDGDQSFQLTFKCSKPGVQRLIPYYNGKMIGIPVAVNIISNQMARAKLDFFQGKVGNIDSPFKFRFIPYDSNNNIPDLSVDSVRSNLNIQWPNVVDSNKNFQIVKDQDGTFIVAVSTDKIGTYSISNPQLFGSFVSNGLYQFSIEAGDVDYSNSFARLLDITKFEIVKGSVNVGAKLLLQVYFKDQGNNPIPTTKINDAILKSVLNSNGVKTLLKNPAKNLLFYAYSFTITAAGSATITVNYLDKPITCQYCALKVNAAANVFEKARLNPWDSKKNSFVDQDQSSYTVNKGDNFLFLLVLNDQFGNTVPVSRATDYTATLSGNNMKVLSLVLSLYYTGVKLEVSSQDSDYYKNLVGMHNYSITVKEKTTNKQKVWLLDIVSDGSDNGAGNGDYVPQNTVWFWLNPLTQDQYAIAGQTYRVAVQLMTNQNLRYSGYIDENLIKCNFKTLLPGLGEVLSGPRKTQVTGTYTFTFTLIQGKFVDRTIGFTIAGVTLSKTKIFKDYPSSPVKARIDTSSLQTSTGTLLKNGVVGTDYSFKYLIFDRYDNPNSLPDNGLGLNIQSLDKKQTLGPDCQKNSVGVYSCIVKPRVFGNYSVDSSFLRNSNVGTYYLYFERERTPTIMKLIAGVLNDLSKGVHPGDVIDFMFIVRDESNTPMSRSEIVELFKYFSLNVQQPGSSSLTNVPLLTINDKGQIQTTFTVNKVGGYQFFPKYQSINIQCPVCSVDVKANQVTADMLVFSYDSSKETPVLNNSAITLDNTKKDPIYILRFKDSFNNALNTPSDGVFTGTLTVPNGAKTVYNFEVAVWGADAMKLRIKDVDYSYYKSELQNAKATLQITSQSKSMSSLNEKFIFPATLKGVSSDDNDYTNDYPDANKSVLSPLAITITAGDWTDLLIELRAANGKLYNHPQTFGWYADKSGSFKMVTTDGYPLAPGVTNGKQKGTYDLHFTCYKAYMDGVYVDVSFLSPKDNKTWVLMGTKFKLTVLPAAPKYLVMDETTVANAFVGQQIANVMKPYDLFGNLVYKAAVNGLAIKMTSSNPNETAIIPQLTQNANGEVVSSYKLTKPGDITITALKFKNSAGKVVNSYSFTVSAGDINFQNSIAQVDKNSIQAGESINWIVYPRDAFNNPLNCNKADLASLSAADIPNSGNSATLTQKIATSANNDYYYWTVTLTVSGTHEFKAFFKGDLIRSTNNKVQVSSGSADFDSTNLALYNSKTNSYDEYDGKMFYQNIANMPEYKINVYDKYHNKVASMPSDWVLSLYLTNTDLGTQYGIFFCFNSTLASFKMCTDNKLQPNMVAPVKRWNDLVVPDDYLLQLKNTKTSSLQNYNMNLSGSSNDSDASNLPVDVQNTILSPLKIQTDVNKTFEFQIVVMTTDKTKRRNEWYDNPMQSIKLTFSKDVLSYSIAYGEKKGMYKVSLLSTKSYVSDPNVISVYITNILVKTKTVSVYVNPGLPYVFFPYDLVANQQLKAPVAGTVDLDYSQAFMANDFWGNLVNLNSDTPNVNSQVFDPQNNIVNHNKDFPLENEFLIISFDPQVAGIFLIKFSENSQFKVIVSQGDISIVKSLGNVSPSEIRAGETVTVSIDLRDQYGNALTLTPAYLQNYKLQYFFSLPNDNVYNQGTSPMNIAKNMVTFTQKLTVKGINKFKVTLNSQPIDMSQSRVTVSPNDPSLPSSILLYLDDDTNKYLLADESVPIKENNTKYDPYYSLVLADKYGNAIDQFPSELQNKFQVILFGNDYAIDNPIHFLSNTVQGNSLSITINPVDRERYRAGIYEKTPYNLSVSLLTTKATNYYNVILLGAGDSDNNADIEKPMDPSMTYFDKNQLKIVAGASDVFMIEIRTTKGTRKADTPTNMPIKLYFSDDSNRASNNNYTYQVSPGDLRGRFIIRVSGTRANERENPAKIIVELNKTANLTTKSVSLTISPAGLDHIASSSDFSKLISADNDFKFIIQPYDCYNNIANVKVIDINLLVAFPVSWTGPIDFNGFIDPATGYANYQVKNRAAGQYVITSNYLKSGNLGFTVVPGAISNQMTRVLVDPLSILAGYSTYINVYPADAYNNSISPIGDRQNDCVNKIALKYRQDDIISSSLLSPNAKNTSMFQSLKLTKAGLVTIVVTVDAKAVTCDGCVVQVLANIANLQQTKFYILSQSGDYQETSHPTSPHGAKNINLMAQLFDAYGNALLQIAQNELFKMTMRGNNMNPLNLIVQKAENQTNGLLIDVDDSDSAYFSSLVVASNYSLTFFYLQDSQTKDTADLLMDITGNSDDSGNGDVDISKTVITPLNLILIAGIESSVMVEFRTSENKRYAGQITITSLLAKETDNSKGTQKLTLSWNYADRTGRFMLTMKSYQSLTGNDLKYLQISLNGQICKNLVTVGIDPDVPDPSKTEVLQQLPFNLKANQQVPTIIRLYDQYDNIYSKNDWASKLQSTAASGRANFAGTTFDSKNQAYTINIVPLYPPRIVEIQLVLTNNAGNQFNLLNIPWISQVSNELDTTKTEIRGDYLSGVQIGNDFTFYVLLKDVDGYCYEATKNINVRLSGPYNDNSLTSKTLTPNGVLSSFIREGMAEGSSTDTNDMMSNGTQCLKYYAVTFYGNQIQQVGYYLIEVFMDNGATPIYSYKNDYMSPGDVFPANSFLSLQSPANLAQSAQLSVYSPIVLRLQLRDSFKNVLTSTNGTTVVLQLPGFNSPQDFTVSQVSGKGYFDFTLLVKKVGVITGGVFLINGQSIQWRTLDQLNVPGSLNYGPAECSSVVPNLDVVGLQANKSLVGSKTFFTVNCLDQYGNSENKGGDVFSAQIISIGDVKTAQSINIPVTVTDHNDGSYLFQFTPTYGGLYKGIVQLNNKPYGSVFFFSVIAGLCDVSTPYYCVNTKKCAASYFDCGYADLSCPTKAKPFKCSVTTNGKKTSTCVATQEECDCSDPVNMIKCSSDKKCVSILQVDNMCSFKGQNLDYYSCPVDYPAMCSDGSCRPTAVDCPSQPGCPPEFRLCPDLSCVQSTQACPDRGETCPGDLFYRCDDFSCVADPEDCPTRITCPIQGQLVCPDGSCVDSEVSCKVPRVCDTGTVLCHDGSCMKSYDDCAKGTTCPTGQSLCSDGTCKKTCLTVTSNSPKTARLLRILDANNTNNSNNSNLCPANQTLCKGTDICVDQANLCPSKAKCKTNEVECSEFSCAASLKECQKQNSCPQGSTQCWDRSCVLDKKLCPTRISCPESFPVLCSDGECSDTLLNCRNATPCPSYRPIRCGTGDCKKSLSECPTQTICPSTNPIRCQDGSCVKDKSTCDSIVSRTKCPQGKVKCSDGSCSVSYSLCPTAVSCAPYQIRCWNMACADDLSSCDIMPGETVCDADKIQCPDGSCANSITDCPTGVICPFERPIKCDDGNCRSSVDQCLRYTDCLETYRRCPDGSCQMGRCSSIAVTCSADAPYKCFDNTCKKNPFDCPDMPECPLELPILCTEGNCVSSRNDCPTVDPCPLGEPVRCPDGLCYNSAENCTALTDCPMNKRLCDDGSCVRNDESCPVVSCPKNLPFSCPNGMCASSHLFCDDSTTGCPFDRPNRCSNGQCVDSLSSCPKSTACAANLTLCPDGTCRSLNGNSSLCPLANGCPRIAPLKCISGDCIDPQKSSCQIYRCPKTRPFKCPNGLCMPKWNACPSIYVPEEANPCKQSQNNRTLLCADGSCVANLDECRPTFSCPKHAVLCADGSCAWKTSLCPLASNSCPLGLNFRCTNRACVNSSADCLNDQGCPSNKPLKCGNYGFCAGSHEECEEIAGNTTLPNNCTLKNPVNCKGQCVASSKDCKTASKCNNGTMECIDGSCQKNISLCPKSCNTDQVLCPISKKCANSSQDCELSNGCPLKTPKKCADGSCIRHHEKCPSHAVCPLFKPYLCADLECVGEASQCSVMPECPKNKPIRCSDLSCVSSANLCKNTTTCPPTNIIKCPTGECVDTVDECKNSQVLVQCSSEKPFLCSNQVCAARPSDCVSADVRNGKSTNSNSRILSENSSIIDSGCSAYLPKRCSDGSCRASFSDCALINGCFDNNYPYRCQSGECAQSSEECTNDKSLLACSNGTTRCEDGICRAECPPYDGCPLSYPYQCPNGMCSQSAAQCQQQNGKMLCVDNSYGDCQRPIRSYKAEEISLFTSAYLSNSVSFISNDDTNLRYATLEIPAGAFTTSNSTNTTTCRLDIAPVASSTLKNTTNVFINQKIMQYLFNGAETLVPEQFIRSSVFSVNQAIEGCLQGYYAKSLTITISIDTIQTLSTNSYCLGYLPVNGSQWVCADSSNSTADLNSNHQVTFELGQDGTYAVILALKESSFVQGGIKEQGNCDWWCANGGAVIGAIVGVLIGGMVFGIFFFGFTKYAAKRQEKAGMNEELIDGKENNNEGKRKLEEMAQNLHQKEKILAETVNEREMIKEQNEKLVKELENLKNELGKA